MTVTFPPAVPARPAALPGRPRPDALKPDISALERTGSGVS
jgi:hypothetical protein